MTEITLTVPESIINPLPDDDDDIRRDLEETVRAWERRLNEILTEMDADDVAGSLADVIERFEDRHERYDEYVVELRSWGQSPIYAISWRNLYASLIHQVYEYDTVADQISQERHARIIAGGFRR